MNSPKSVLPTDSFPLPFYSVRNISCPEDLSNNRKVYVGHAPITSILNLSTDENVRAYLLEAEGRKRRVPTQVHRAIQDTLENNSDIFSVLNSGIVIVARSCEIDEAKKLAVLKGPSIINGSQTQGVIKDLFARSKDNGESFRSCHIKFEVIVTTDEDLIAEISIARNYQNDVMTISIAGRRGQLDELEESIQKKKPDWKLKKSETSLSDDYIKTERLLQVVAALVPEEIWPKNTEFSKVYAYSMKTKCLKNFQDIYEKAKNADDPEHSRYLELYQFYLDIAADAWDVYEKWKAHQGFYGTKLRAIEREGGKIIDVPDGIVFPILASLANFTKKTSMGWVIQAPKIFNEEELIKSAASVYQEIASSNPNVMGKSKACYSALYQITSIYKKLSGEHP